MMQVDEVQTQDQAVEIWKEIKRRCSLFYERVIKPIVNAIRTLANRFKEAGVDLDRLADDPEQQEAIRAIMQATKTELDSRHMERRRREWQQIVNDRERQKIKAARARTLHYRKKKSQKRNMNKWRHRK